MQSLWRYFQQISSPVSTEKEQNKLPYMPKKKKTQKLLVRKCLAKQILWLPTTSNIWISAGIQCHSFRMLSVRHIDRLLRLISFVTSWQGELNIYLSTLWNCHEWPSLNFSLQYQLNIKQTIDENENKPIRAEFFKAGLR